MATSFSSLAIRRNLGVTDWDRPYEFGPDGWYFDNLHEKGRVIVSAAPFEGTDYLHASIAFQDRMPTYAELTLVHYAVFPGYSYQVFAPREDHINIHPNALHLWGRVDGKPDMPEFGSYYRSI